MKALLISTVFLFVLTMTSCSKDEDPQPIPTPLEVGIAGDDLLIPNVKKILEDSNMPGMAVMTMKSGQILEKAEYGVQKTGTTDSILENSKWHMGSITKSMTATLTGILIEKGFLTWETSIGDLTTEGYIEDYQTVTILQLLSQTGGIIAEDYPIDPSDTRDVSELRQEWAIAVLNMQQGTVGEFAYRNTNYVIVGVMLEMIMEDTWENLITEYLFEPLGMNDTGFGAPGNNGETGQPWGHRHSGNSWTLKDPLDVYSDNPTALGPAGTVHTTLIDLSKYANLHLGKTNLISASTLEVLHAEVNNSGYALGWNVNDSGIYHAGSNNNWFAQLYINLDVEYSNFAATNSYDNEAQISIPAINNMMAIMGKRYENSL